MTERNSLVLGLDIATVTGFAHGRVDADCPSYGCIRFGTASSPSPEVFAKALGWASTLLATLKPDVVMLEALLPPTAMKNRTSREVRDRLCGLNAIIMACAKTANVPEIASASVGDIRAHFIYDRTLKRKSAKAEVMAKCHQLGWDVPNDNTADACAVWSYACALIDPRLGLRGSPLFTRIASIA